MIYFLQQYKSCADGNFLSTGRMVRVTQSIIIMKALTHTFYCYSFQSSCTSTSPYILTDVEQCHAEGHVIKHMAEDQERVKGREVEYE